MIPIRVPKRAAAITAALVLGATGTALGGAQAAQTSPATPTCHVADLHLSIGPVSGGAGSLFYPIRFTNTSRHTCALRGYPGVSVVNIRHHQIGAPAARTGQPVTTVQVRPHRSATQRSAPTILTSCRSADRRRLTSGSTRPPATGPYSFGTTYVSAASSRSTRCNAPHSRETQPHCGGASQLTLTVHAAELRRRPPCSPR
ncbi:DUF4232 domain-containing protein [Streptomyces sp. NBC_01537]|uniref:DUF4232 domain-containing protein n=1 Tax=Streptomyces sp. NBC_01537 TaxID=2903896 RepID=UPI00386B88D7